MQKSESKNLPIKISISFILVFAFPYLSLGYGDTSPFIFTWMAILSLLKILYLKKSIRNQDLIWMTITLCVAILFYGISDTALRVVAYGLMIPFCSIVFKNPDLHELYRATKLVRFIYMLMAFIQVTIGLEAYSSVAATFMNVRYADGRGLTSVGPEPTAFAILYLLFSITAYHITKITKPEIAKKILAVDLILIFAITLSSTYVMYLVIYAILILLSQGKLIKLTYFIFIACLLSAGMIIVLPDLRLSSILLNIISLDISDALNLLSIFDESVLDRLSQPLIALWYSVSNYMIPTKPSAVVEFAVNLGPAFEYLSSEKYNRTHLNTGIGELFVYFGLLAIYPLYRIIQLFKKSANAGLMFSIIYIFSIPFGHPSYWSALVICYFVLTHPRNNKILNSSSVSAVKGC